MIENLNTDKPNNKNEKNNITPNDNHDKDHNTKSIINIIGQNNNKTNKQNIDYEKMTINNFFSYLIFKFSFEKKNTYHKIFKDFRMKMISEEHLVKNHLNIYNLLKANERKKSFRRRSLLLKDLINLV